MLDKVKNELKLDRTKLTYGDKVWAFSYRNTRDKESKSLYQKPIYGMMTYGNTEASNNRLIKIMQDKGTYGEDDIRVRYFTPFKKNGKDLAWSKSVLSYNREYAETEEDAKILYNGMVQLIIDWHNKEIERLNKEKI